VVFITKNLPVFTLSAFVPIQGIFLCRYMSFITITHNRTFSSIISALYVHFTIKNSLILYFRYFGIIQNNFCHINFSNSQANWCAV